MPRKTTKAKRPTQQGGFLPFIPAIAGAMGMGKIFGGRKGQRGGVTYAIKPVRPAVVYRGGALKQSGGNQFANEWKKAGKDILSLALPLAQSQLMRVI